MKRFKITIINSEGKKVSRYENANSSKEAIDKVCAFFDVGYENIIDIVELEG